MGINVRGGKQNLVHAKLTIPLDSTGLDSSNTNILYEFDSVITSWQPGREFNPLTVLIKGNGYLLNAKIDMDLENIFMPPFNGIILEDGGEILPE